MELDDLMYKELTTLTNHGNELVELGKLEEALHVFFEALELIPTPKEEWDAAMWLYVAIGDTYFFLDNYKESLNYFFDALICSDNIKNPFIHLRLGQCFFELENKEKTKEHFLIAYSIEGDKIFHDEDKKYLFFFNSFK